MATRYLEPSEPVTVTTFGYMQGDVCETIYFIIVRETSPVSFLRQAYRPLQTKSWSDKLAKAVLFNTAESAREFAKEHFFYVNMDL